MTKEWQIKVGAAALAYAGEAGVEDISIAYASLATDIVTLKSHPDFDIAYGTIVEIHYAGTRRFLGRCVRSVLSEGGVEALRTIRLAGPWEWLERIPYRQSWQMWNDDELGPTLTSRVILNQDADGDAISVEAQLADIVGHAATRGAPLAFGLAAVSLTLPWDEQRDITCAAAIARLLRYTPAVASWIDYSGATPMIYFGGGAALTLPASAETRVSGYRDDLVVPGLTIEIERISTVTTDDGANSYRSLDFLTAGTTAAVDALFATLQLAGSDSSKSVMRLDVETEAIPDPLTDAAWWIARHSRLKNVAAADLSFIQAVRRNLRTGLLVTDPEDYPRISLNPMTDLSAMGINARVEQFRAIVDIVQRDEDGAITESEHAVNLSLDVITTNATTRTYSKLQSYSATSAEPTPANLATELLAHLSVRYAEGSASWPIRDLWAAPGNTLYSTPIQTVHVSSADKLAEVAFGPPQHLSVADFAAVLQGFRTRRASISWKARTNAEPAAENELEANQASPARVPGFAPGAKRHLSIAAAAGAGGSVVLDPTKLDDDETITVKEISWKDADNQVQRAKVLASDNIPQDGTDPPADVPPCGHPGNEPGGESDNGDGSPTDYPDDEPGGGSGGGGSGTSDDHPGDTPSPPSSGDCE